MPVQPFANPTLSPNHARSRDTLPNRLPGYAEAAYPRIVQLLPIPPVGRHRAMSHSELIAKAFGAFSLESAAKPSVTLRGGNAIDNYDAPPPFDPSLDEISEMYLEKYPWGIGYLDPVSWRHYLPHLIEYSITHMTQGGLVVESFLSSLRPPDQDPPRLASLTSEQEAIVTAFLEFLAFSKQSAHQEFACQVLEEWWLPGALYREEAT